MPDRQTEKAASPPTWKAMLVKWLGLVPALMAVAYGIGWIAPDLPKWGTLLLESAILVPMLNYGISPLMKWVFEDWLYRDVGGERAGMGIGE